VGNNNDMSTSKNLKHYVELDPDKRPWEYSCDGTKVWKNTGWTRIWSDEDQENYDKLKDYDAWKNSYGHDWEEE
jgi:hypothetical protein